MGSHATDGDCDVLAPPEKDGGPMLKPGHHLQSPAAIFVLKTALWWEPAPHTVPGKPEMRGALGGPSTREPRGHPAQRSQPTT